MSLLFNVMLHCVFEALFKPTEHEFSSNNITLHSADALTMHKHVDYVYLVNYAAETFYFM